MHLVVQVGAGSARIVGDRDTTTTSTTLTLSVSTGSFGGVTQEMTTQSHERTTAASTPTLTFLDSASPFFVSFLVSVLSVIRN